MKVIKIVILILVFPVPAWLTMTTLTAVAFAVVTWAGQPSEATRTAGAIVRAAHAVVARAEKRLDKTGTTELTKNVDGLQVLNFKALASRGSFLAERAGFEPADRFYPIAALAKRCFRPLSHLSRVDESHHTCAGRACKTARGISMGLRKPLTHSYALGGSRH